MKDIVIDSSSAILLIKAGIFEMLISHYNVNIGETVFRELTVLALPGSREIKELRRKGGILVSSVEPINISSIPLTGGELETVILYHNGKGCFIIIDDKEGADYCRKSSIPFVNALLIPRIFLLAGLLNEPAFGKISELILKNGRYSKDIVQRASVMNKENLEFFFP